MKIKDLCKNERPRERMIRRGPESLSDAELLAILIGSGTQRENVIDVANRLLTRCEGKLSRIAAMSLQDMIETDGIGPGRYSSIAAAMELGRRRCLETPVATRERIRNAAGIWRLMSGHFQGMHHEEFWAVFLNRAGYVIHSEMLSKGGVSSTIVDSRIFVKSALDRHATGVIMVHNHPSGDPRPGQNDVEQTEKMKKALNTFDIMLIDHVIISDSCYFSFSDDNVLPPPDDSAG